MPFLTIETNFNSVNSDKIQPREVLRSIKFRKLGSRR